MDDVKFMGKLMKRLRLTLTLTLTGGFAVLAILLIVGGWVAVATEYGFVVFAAIAAGLSVSLPVLIGQIHMVNKRAEHNAEYHQALLEMVRLVAQTNADGNGQSPAPSSPDDED